MFVRFQVLQGIVFLHSDQFCTLPFNQFKCHTMIIVMTGVFSWARQAGDLPQVEILTGNDGLAFLIV